jgi:hypothetical protein
MRALWAGGKVNGEFGGVERAAARAARLLPATAMLGDVMRMAGKDDAGSACRAWCSVR